MGMDVDVSSVNISSGSGVASPGSGGYKRASRKGAPRRFPCDYPNCDKIYSRAEHLQRHQLNRECLFLWLCCLSVLCSGELSCFILHLSRCAIE